jgi:hypothetical protein
MPKCVMCKVTTEDLTGWFLLQVSTAQFIRPDGVDNCTTETSYAHDATCLVTWLNRAEVQHEFAGSTGT